MSQLPTIPSKFRATALAFPSQVKKALSRLKDPAEAKQMLDQSDALSRYAKRIKAENEIVNAIQHGKLLVIAKYGELNQATPRAKRGQGRPNKGKGSKKSTVPATVDFADHTLATYRKVAKLQGYIDAYVKHVMASDGEEEISILGFIEWVLGKRRTRNPSFPPAPAGEYSVILADPPWQYEFAETKRRRTIENQYPTVDLKSLCELEIPAASHAVLFLWATAPKLKDAIKVLDSWQFEYKSCAVWDKEVMGMGYWFRGAHELLLVGTQGSPPAPAEEKRVSSIIKSRRSKHSQKPIVVYDMIESWYPHEPKIELFARETRKGWDSWGNEL